MQQARKNTKELELAKEQQDQKKIKELELEKQKIINEGKEINVLE
jgi:hypothetical protein